MERSAENAFYLEKVRMGKWAPLNREALVGRDCECLKLPYIMHNRETSMCYAMRKAKWLHFWTLFPISEV